MNERNYLRIVLLCVCFFAIVSLPVCAQINFRQGYIISHKNDTVYGWIDFRTAEQNARICRFRKDDVQKEFFPGDICSYRFLEEGKYYFSSEIEVKNEKRVVFLEYLVKGVMDLYYYKESDENEYYFFQDEEGRMVPVTRKQDYMEELKYVKDDKYKGQLTYLFREYPQIRESVKSTYFTRKDMIGLAKNYHALVCNTGEECIEFENDYKKLFVDFHVSVYGGAALFGYTFNAEEYLHYVGTCRSISPVLGAQAELSFPRITRSWSLVTDVAVTGIGGEKEQYKKYPESIYRYDFNAGLLMGKFNLKWTAPSGKFCPVVSAGFSSFTLFAIKSNYRTEFLYTNYIPDRHLKNEYQPVSFMQGYNVEAGLDYAMKRGGTVFLRISCEQGFHSNDDRIGVALVKAGYKF